jgi:hypothetical protein
VPLFSLQLNLPTISILHMVPQILREPYA